MALDPTIYDKTIGDGLRASDWNVGLREVARLEDAKINRAGDTINGPLSVRQLTVDGLTVRQSVTAPVAGDVTMLGMFQILAGPFVLPPSREGILYVEQYPVGKAPAGFPAFARITSISPLEILDTRVDWVNIVTVGGVTSVLRSLHVARGATSPGDVTFTAVVFSSVDTFKPYFELRT
jgi:hypothetical protein